MSFISKLKCQSLLLDWFSKYQRVMPWRAVGKELPNPYHVWMSEIMLQQTTVVTVGSYFMKFINRWPTVHDLALAKQDDVLAAWAGLGYYARARNLHKCAKVISEEYGGKFPKEEEVLRALPGIGPYTAAAISSIAFNQPAVAVDGNVERVVSRFYGVDEPLPHSKNIVRQYAAKLSKGNLKPSDFTQAFMELGATVCTPRKPRCGACPWKKPCRARIENRMEELPRKVPKAKKPIRYGKVFWIQKKSGAFLIERREGTGLYEGMYQLPTTEWVTDKNLLIKTSYPYGKKYNFENLNEVVRHSFTHFDLVLEVWLARLKKGERHKSGLFVLSDQMQDYALPSLMKKTVKVCIKNKVS